MAVVSQPDRPGSRGKPAPRPVADCAEDLGIPVLRPERIRDADATSAVLDFGADVLVVAAYGQILPPRLLEGFRLGGVNVHASLLPRWRGASPINAAILHGDARTGVAIMRMEAGLDTGPVYTVREVALDATTTAPALTLMLASVGAAALGEVLDGLRAGALAAMPQPEEGITYAPRLTRDDGMVIWADHTAVDVDRRVRALDPWPGVNAVVAGRRVRICAGLPVETVAAGGAGEAVTTSDGSIDVIAANASVYRISEIQAPGSRRMPAGEWARGQRL